MAQCCCEKSKFYEAYASVCHWPHQLFLPHLSPISKVMRYLASLTLGTFRFVYSGLVHHSLKVV